MKKLKIFLFVVTIITGGYLIVLGEIDDSPGGMFLGFMMISVGIITLIRHKSKKY